MSAVDAPLPPSSVAGRSPPPPWWSRRGMPWFGGLFIVVIVALAAFDIVRGYRSALLETGRDLDSQARVLAEQTARSLQAVDLVLRHIAEQSRSGALGARDARDLYGFLKDQAVGLVQIEGLSLIDAAGTVVASSVRAELPDPPLNVAAVELFQRVRGDLAGGLQVGSSWRSILAPEQWVFPIARRLESPSGAFAGAVVAGGKVEYFQQFYRDVRLESGTIVTLMHRNGTLLARHPAMASALGRRYALFDSVLAAPRDSDGEPRRLTSPIDGVERFGSVVMVAGYPLGVAVTRDADLALAPWREQAIGTVLRTLALGLLAASLLALLRRQFQRLDRTRQSLEVSRERFALAAAGADDGIWDWDLVGDAVYTSERARELFGADAGPETQSRGEWFSTLDIHPDDAAARSGAMREHMAGRVPVYASEFRVRHRDGHYRWVRVRGLCVRDEHGVPQRMAGSVSDIHARKCAEDSLRRSEERYALAVAGSDDGVWDWDFKAGVAFESTRARELQGLPPGSEVLPLPQLVESLRVHPDDAPRRAEGIRAHLAGETAAYECEYRVRHDDGTYRWIRVRALCTRDSAGQPQRMAGSVSDIDARKRAEEALRISEQRYQLAVDGSNEGLWDWDLVSDSLFLSPRAQELLWLTPGPPLRPRREWIALTPYHPEDRETVRRAITAHLRGTSPHYKIEYRLRHHSGDWRWYRQRGVAVRDAQGRATRMAGSMEDITDRKLAEAERERLEAQLRQAQKLEAIGTLAGGIAHDFNNILAAILGYGEMAQKGAAEGSAQRRYIDASISAGMRAKSLVQRILAFSRSGMGERVPVHVQSVVDEALEAVAASLPTSVTLQRRLDAGDAAVMGDPTQVHQVVMNLCANAVQAMKSGGVLTVGLERVDSPPPRCATSVLPAGSYVRLSVGDTGSGIAPQLLERIFDPFFTTKEVGVGTGLGLSLVHGIVTDLGGGIDIDSRPGEGTTFTIHLPWQACAAPPARVEAAVPAGGGQIVLLVDDEEALVRLGEEMIADLGYEPVGFHSAAAALAALRADPTHFDAVLSDEAMPEMTGSELAREIRALRPDLPIVLMSGYVTPALVQRARDAGVLDVLAKPLVAGDIARCLVAALQRGAATSPAFQLQSNGEGAATLTQ